MSSSSNLPASEPAGAAAGASPHFVKAWRRISTDEIGLHVAAVELRREVNATESLMLSREQARRVATDIYELLAEDDPGGASVSPQLKNEDEFAIAVRVLNDHDMYEEAEILQKRAAGASVSVAPQPQGCCLDCGLPYAAFPLDLNLPRAQWLLIHPEGENGLLCAGCIVKRAARIPGATVVHAVIEIAPLKETSQVFNGADSIKAEAGTADQTRLRTALQALHAALVVFANDHVREAALWPAGERAQQVARMLRSYADRLREMANGVEAVLARERPLRPEEKEGV